MIPGKLFIISASSGAGKTTLVTEVVERISLEFSLERVITYTTRAPRLGEKNSHDYYFITEQTFKQHIEQGFFLEWSAVYGAYYGSPKQALYEVEAGESRILIVDRVGAKQIQVQQNAAVLIWVDAGGAGQLRQRLAVRQTENDTQVERRLALAQEEAESERQEKLYQYYVLNDHFQHAVTQLINIIRDELKIK